MSRAEGRWLVDNACVRAEELPRDVSRLERWLGEDSSVRIERRVVDDSRLLTTSSMREEMVWRYLVNTARWGAGSRWGSGKSFFQVAIALCTLGMFFCHSSLAFAFPPPGSSDELRTGAAATSAAAGAAAAGAVASDESDVAESTSASCALVEASVGMSGLLIALTLSRCFRSCLSLLRQMAAIATPKQHNAAAIAPTDTPDAPASCDSPDMTSGSAGGAGGDAACGGEMADGDGSGGSDGGSDGGGDGASKTTATHVRPAISAAWSEPRQLVKFPRRSPLTTGNNVSSSRTPWVAHSSTRIMASTVRLVGESRREIRVRTSDCGTLSLLARPLLRLSTHGKTAEVPLAARTRPRRLATAPPTTSIPKAKRCSSVAPGGSGGKTGGGGENGGAGGCDGGKEGGGGGRGAKPGG